MRIHLLFTFLTGMFLQENKLSAQDTFSILAFDSITGEVGGAGASCVDLTNILLTNDFIIELFPGEGAIATQAAYITANQVNACNRFIAGDSPTQILGFMQSNDQTSTPDVRQYGVVCLNRGYPKCAAFTGSNCMAYKNHLVGKNYSIQGNILLGQQVLDSMEARFIRSSGDLACKLMAAMQGAKMVGADSRCAGNGSSSLFAFLKVAQPTDPFGQPSFLVSLKTANGAGIEPIDSLQSLFNAQKNCLYNPLGLHSFPDSEKFDFLLYPHPVDGSVTINPGNKTGILYIRTFFGQVVFEKPITGPVFLDTNGWQKGIYLVEFEGKTKKMCLIRP